MFALICLFLLLPLLIFLQRILACNFFIDNLYRFLKHHCQLQYSIIFHMNLIQFQYQPLPCFIDSKIIPFTPCSVISQLFLPYFVVGTFYFFKLLHKFEINCCNLFGMLEFWVFYCLSFWNLYVYTNKKIREQFNI